MQVIEGQEAVIECKARGEPPPTITWERNSRRLATRLRHIVMENVRLPRIVRS